MFALNHSFRYEIPEQLRYILIFGICGKATSNPQERKKKLVFFHFMCNE